MGISKSTCSWILKGVKSTSGNTMTMWKTNFNMPVPLLFNGDSTYDDGFMDIRYCSVGGTSQSLAGFCPGYELVLGDALNRWCVSNSSCLDGIGCITLKWYRGATCLFGNAFQYHIDLPAPGSGSWVQSWYESAANIGIASWEICANGTYGTVAEVTTVSGDDVSIGAVSTCIDFGDVPAVTTCSCSMRGSIWVEGEDLHYINANCWEHVIVGVCQSSGATGGEMWIGNDHYLNWAGETGDVYKTPWRICQFCSSFSNGAPANPSPGAGYAGALWVDNQFGWTHLSYIGCDGKKYLTGGGNYPYIAP